MSDGNLYLQFALNFVCNISNIFLQRFEKTFQLKKHIRQSHELVECPQMNCNEAFLMVFGRNSLETHLKIVHNKTLKKPNWNNENMKECPECGQGFSDIDRLQEHLETHPNYVTRFKCEKCQQVFAHKTPLKRHKCSNCDICEKIVPGVIGIHKEEVHGLPRNLDLEVSKREPRFLINGVRFSKCKYCEELYERGDLLKNHYRIIHENHTKLTRHCGHCNQEFQLAKDFYEHIDSQIDVHICRVCGVSCTSDIKLYDHKQKAHRHKSSAPAKFACDRCGKTFPARRPLTIHFRVHTKERPFSCTECNKTFRYESQHHNHMKMHNGALKCPLCPRLFPKKFDLNEHKRTHGNEKVSII